MKKVLKIFGLPRSGTNLMEILIPLNFNVDTCLRREFNDHLGWKHARPLPIQNYNTLGHTLQEQYYFLFSIRDKEEWIKTINEKHWGSFEMPWEFKNNNFYIFNTPMGPEIYENIEQFYDFQIQSYKDFCATNPDNALLVDYNDFKTDQTVLLNLIKNKFNFEMAQNAWITINKKINWNGQLTNCKF